jgi:lipopolysaccharide heptosyltransferase II
VTKGDEVDSASTHFHNWQEARRILCVRLDAMGDVLMTGPAISAIKSGRKETNVVLLTSTSGAVAGRLLPAVDEIVEYSSPWMKATACREDPSSDIEMIDRLRRMRIDAAIIFTVYSQNPLPAALLCYLAGIPLRTAHCRENPYQLLTHWVREFEPDEDVRHEVRRQLDLVAAVGFDASDERMSVGISADATGRVVGRMRSKGIDPFSESWIVLHAGATAASRRYPTESFAAVVSRLTSQGYRIVLTGDASECSIVDEIRWLSDRKNTVSVCGDLNFEQLAALIQLAPLLISNNSSPVHLASALGTPVVDLYALTNPQHTPWMVPNRVLFSDVPCRFCYRSVCPEGHHECLRGVTPDQVFDAAMELLKGEWNRNAASASALSKGGGVVIGY